MSFQKDDDENKVLPVVVIPDSVVFRQSGGQLMVAMQPGIDMPAVEVQEVVVVTDRGRGMISEDRNQGLYVEELCDEIHARGEDEMAVDYDDGSEAVAAEIEVADVAMERVHDDFLVSSIRNRNERVRGKSKRGRFKQRGRYTMKKSPVKMMIKKQVEMSPDFDDSYSDIGESSSRGAVQKPRKRDFALRLQWNNDDMKEAMKAVDEKKKTIRGAAKDFNVPYSTLKDRVRGRVRHGTKPGVKTRLSPEEEEELVRCIEQMDASGFQVHCINIRERAYELLAQYHGRDSMPGHNWLAGFLKRHPGIDKCLKRSVNRPVTPSTGKQKQMIKRFFDVASCAYRKLHGPTQANQLYSMNELHFSSSPHTSIIVAAAANGTCLPPYVIFKGARPLLPGLQEVFPSAFFSTFPSSCLKEDILFSWFRDHFLKHVSPSRGSRPVVLFVSIPVGNISVRLMQLASDKQIALVCIPNGISHLVQPLNDSVLRGIDELVSKREKKLSDDRKIIIDQRGMAEILYTAWQKGLPSKEIVANFRENGLFPFNVRAVSNERIISSIPAADVSKMDSALSDSETNGLTLLSELSSAEYVSMEHISDQSTNETSRNSDLKRKRNSSNEHVFTMSPVKRRHKLPAEKSHASHDNFDISPKAEDNAHGFANPRLSRELMKHVLANENGESSCSRTRPVPRIGDRRYPDVHQEILASRTNPEQLELAIKSIVEENSKSTFSHKRSTTASSQRPGTSEFSRGHHSKQNQWKASKPNVTNNVDVLTTERNSSKFVTLTPVHHVIEVSPNVKQEYISYVEDPNAIQEEFVPQEMVEEQTIIQDCMAYDIVPDSYCKEEVIEELVEEVVDLPDLMLSAEEITEEAEVKLENPENEYMNNNELNYDLQSNGTTDHSLAAAPAQQLKTIKFSELESRLKPNDQVKIIQCFEMGDKSCQIVRTMSLQEFSKQFGAVPRTSGGPLGGEPVAQVTDKNSIENFQE